MPNSLLPADRARLQHMLEAAQTTLRFVEGRERADLETDEMLSFAVTRGLEIIGEASKNISAEWKAAHPEIPWRDIGRARDFYAHGYFMINLDRVWKTATTDLAPLIEQLENILTPEDDNGSKN